MENKKFKLIKDDTVKLFNRTLYRIEALKDFGNVSKGDKGGYIEKEANLSADGNAWVYDNAQVYGDARVYDNAQVYGDARVCDNAHVYGNAQVYGNARVRDNAQVCGNAEVNSSLTLIVIGPIGSEDGTLTAFKNKQGTISVTRGCFAGSLEEFEQAVDKTHGDNKHAKTYKIAIELIKSRLEV